MVCHCPRSGVSGVLIACYCMIVCVILAVAYHTMVWYNVDICVIIMEGYSMNSISQGILDNYQVRFNKKQKASFVQYLRDSLPQHDITTESGGMGGNTNIVVGDVDSAKVIYTAHYDTQPVMLLPIPMIMTPNNWFWFLFFQAFLIIAFMALVAVVMILLGVGQYINIAFIVMCLLLVLAPANRHTVNDNTSGVICLVELLSRDDVDTSKVAFVFFDNEEKGLFGSSFFAKKHPRVKRHTPIVNMDCVAVGDTVMVLKSKKISKTDSICQPLCDAFADVPEGKQLSMQDWCLYPSDQMKFDKGIAVVTAKRSRIIGLYLDKVHTPFDTKMQVDNITYIVDSLAAMSHNV